jgi:hypothetical protein
MERGESSDKDWASRETLKVKTADRLKGEPKKNIEFGG